MNEYIHRVCICKQNCFGYGMDSEKWSMDFKKLKKSSSKKFMKGGLGFFLSPRDESKENKEVSPSSSKESQGIPGIKKTTGWDNDDLILEHNNESDVQSKDYIDDIPVIPSLDDFAEDDITNQIAKAPLVGMKQVATYKELESDLLRHSAFASLEEVNLRVLIKLLHPESCLEEPDISWTRDSLFNEVVSRINERKT